MSRRDLLLRIPEELSEDLRRLAEGTGAGPVRLGLRLLAAAIEREMRSAERPADQAARLRELAAAHPVPCSCGCGLTIKPEVPT